MIKLHTSENKLFHMLRYDLVAANSCCPSLAVTTPPSLRDENIIFLYTCCRDRRTMVHSAQEIHHKHITPNYSSQSFKTCLCSALKLSFATCTGFYIINGLSCTYITFYVFYSFHIDLFPDSLKSQSQTLDTLQM